MMNESISQILNSLTCPICYEVVSKPLITHCCGQIVCSFCFKRWEEIHSTCPICRSQTHHRSGQLLSFIDQLTSFLLDLSKSPLSISQINLCQKHQKKFEFCCTDCNEYLCSECLFSVISKSEHQKHSIVKAENMIKIVQKQIGNELMILHDDLHKIQIQISSVRENVIQLKNEQLERKNEADNSYHNVMNRYVDSLETLNDNCYQSIKKSKKFTRKLENVKKDIRNILQLSPFELLMQIKDNETEQKFNSKMNEIKAEIPPYLQEQSISNPSNEYIPSEEKGLFSIENFHDLIINCGDNFFYSKSCFLVGCKWRVKIFPNGMNDEKGIFSIFLEMSKGPSIEYFYTFQISLNSQRIGIPNLSKTLKSLCGASSSLGWNKIARIDYIEENFVSENGKLSIELIVHPQNYYQVHQNYQFIIERQKQKISNFNFLK